ncbi:MAG: hypothetical protein Q4D62_02935 [Planctomycetia bacterium]|nr:hypothetical protein [Planctomycetia bacterium]
MKWSRMLLGCVLVLGMAGSGNACEKCGGEKHPPRKIDEILLAEAVFASYPAMLCNSCGFGNRGKDCVKCGKWTGGQGVPAMLCHSCGFGNKNKNCVSCGKWIGSNGVRALLCSSCGFGTKKDHCVSCGKWMCGKTNFEERI